MGKAEEERTTFLCSTMNVRAVRRDDGSESLIALEWDLFGTLQDVTKLSYYKQESLEFSEEEKEET